MGPGPLRWLTPVATWRADIFRRPGRRTFPVTRSMPSGARTPTRRETGNRPQLPSRSAPAGGIQADQGQEPWTFGASDMPLKAGPIFEKSGPASQFPMIMGPGRGCRLVKPSRASSRGDHPRLDGPDAGRHLRPARSPSWDDPKDQGRSNGKRQPCRARRSPWCIAPDGVRAPPLPVSPTTLGDRQARDWAGKVGGQTARWIGRSGLGAKGQ